MSGRKNCKHSTLMLLICLLGQPHKSTTSTTQNVLLPGGLIHQDSFHNLSIETVYAFSQLLDCIPPPSNLRKARAYAHGSFRMQSILSQI